MSRPLSSRDLYWLAGGVLAAGALAWKRQEVSFLVADTILQGRGRRLTIATTDAAGNVLEAPAELAAAAAAVVGRPVSVEAYSVARMVRSEGALAANPRAHVLLNDAAALGWSVARTVTFSQSASKTGRYGLQAGRRYATTSDPYEGDLAAAEVAIAEHAAGLDPTGGAVKFVDRGAFGVQAGTGSYDAIVAAWALEGLEPATVPGYPTSFVVFRRSIREVKP